MSRLIYIVEDDSSIRQLLKEALSAAGYRTQGFADGEAALEAIWQRQPDAVILDLMLPGMDGLELCRKMRNNATTAQTPIIMLTARTEEIDRVLGLEMGADDYVSKPFGVRELLARIKAVLRRTEETHNTEVLRSGELLMDPQRHIVTLGGQPLELTLKEFELLRLFLSNIERVFSREVLLEKIWGYDYAGETRTVDVHVQTLRRKLGQVQDAATGIITVRGMGYKYIE